MPSLTLNTKSFDQSFIFYNFLKILHITNWYPNHINEYEALWIQKHIKSLDNRCENFVIHFEILGENGFEVIKKKSNSLCQTIIKLPFGSWLIKELTYFLFVFYIFIVKRTHKKYDIINFHVAYPMLTFWHWIQRWVKKPVVITEHWSAYHFNFGTKKKLPRIRRIFQQNIPVISVSNALSNDIKQFAQSNFPTYVVHNIVDEKIFYPDKNFKKENYFFAVSQWKPPKNPLVVMDAFLSSSISDTYQLKIGGYGVLWNKMKNFVIENKAENKIILLEELTSHEIAYHMKKCKAFLHPSDYETFSVVCAEAVSCGAFVIAPNIGGLPEVIGSNGQLLDQWKKEDWMEALQRTSVSPPKSSKYINSFGRKKIGLQYYKILMHISEEFRK
ncbi:glycosyltransferase [Marivirga salinae]|uniref:Glycosyltransferase n=1 Tax=Marivirga salinarum TaxID=3059078 RepID=A0AA51NBV5_9BACT|nr:glycosyltransferase [Marivirga sp. BDSF4-3]WMN12185.1 glycosyltransferase [Marivirga sp. BDSF4-3]